MDLDLETVVHEALTNARAAGKDYLTQEKPRKPCLHGTGGSFRGYWTLC